MLTYCKACKGSGVYVGMGERNGAAVVCRRCDGAGSEEYVAKLPPEFRGRIVLSGIKTVAWSQGYMLEPGTDPGEIRYEEFLAGSLPAEGLLK